MIVRFRYLEKNPRNGIEEFDCPFKDFDPSFLEGKDVADMYIYNDDEPRTPIIHVDYFKNVTYLQGDVNGIWTEKHFHPELIEEESI